MSDKQIKQQAYQQLIEHEVYRVMKNCAVPGVKYVREPLRRRRGVAPNYEHLGKWLVTGELGKSYKNLLMIRMEMDEEEAKMLQKWMDWYDGSSLKVLREEAENLKQFEKNKLEKESEKEEEEGEREEENSDMVYL